MIVGTRPCCGALSMVEIGPAPCWERIICDACGGVVWLRHSRFDPEMYTEADFLARYTVDEHRNVRTRTPAAPVDPEPREDAP